MVDVAPRGVGAAVSRAIVPLSITGPHGEEAGVVQAELFLPGLYLHQYFQPIPEAGRAGWYQLTHKSGAFVIGGASRHVIEAMRDALSVVDWDVHPGQVGQAHREALAQFESEEWGDA